ncbi:Uma2 family endonuclease [Pueribacillus theae]|uniref:Uma2 family endonuclease n=1 Tax=Pueribacillus theae TaxID=2171751 RepID=A0A2U1K530_9BACI|nr:Uma2 family endonuclease [Pueribacillus theae]PWA12058.1 Uma2 family endonuclease [Pueribacillus theae]
MAPPHENNSLTYAEYLKLDEEVQYEVIDGRIYNMSPSPNVKHQSIAMELSTEFNVYLRNKSCRVLAEVDVCLCEEEDLTKVNEWVKPDIVIVCDEDKIHKSRIVGAPDLIVEILSKSTAKTDRMIKFHRYQRAGVKEYWIVDPAHETIDAYVLENELYKHNGTYTNDEVIEVRIFDDLSIDLKNVFREEFEK